MSVFNIESREQFISEVFPDGVPALQSRDYLKESAIDWSVSRSRLLKTAIRNGDEEQAKTVIREYAAIVGIDRAIQVFLEIWGNVVTENMEDEPIVEDLDTGFPPARE
ncbi:MAG TPA: hypothetical protein VLH19_02420 [Patescibacteria group bacterium]|nr:hypothetical protein [Patescibacteria group bacterium]